MERLEFEKEVSNYAKKQDWFLAYIYFMQKLVANINGSVNKYVLIINVKSRYAVKTDLILSWIDECVKAGILKENKNGETITRK